MPMDEDKQLTKGEELNQFAQETAKNAKQDPNNPALQFKDGGKCPDCGVELEEYTTKGNWTYLMAKGHPQKVKHKTEDGKCANSWADHPKKDGSKTTTKKKSDYNQDFPISSTELIRIITENAKFESGVIESYIEQGGENAWITLAKFTGCLGVCEKLGNTKSAFVGMIFKIGEKSV